MRKYKINEYLTLKLNHPMTEIYVKGEYFMQCKRLLLNISNNDIEKYSDIESIDDATEIYNYSIQNSQFFRENKKPKTKIHENSLIEPEEEFWGHCSNLQVWVEHDYDTNLLKANLAFPLLEKLANSGDRKAFIKLKEEILKRILSGNKPVTEYLFVEKYLDYLENEELIYGLLNLREAEALLNLQKVLGVVFKFVPCINRSLEVPWKERHLIRKFSVLHKKVTGLDLSNCNLKEFLHELFELKNIEILNIGGNSSLIFLKDLKSNLEHLKILVLSENQIKNLTRGSEEIIKERNIKIITAYSGDFISLDYII